MANTTLKDLLETSAPKCSNCAWWHRYRGAWGECKEPASLIRTDEAIEMNKLNRRLTSDLMRCSHWTSQDGE